MSFVQVYILKSIYILLRSSIYYTQMIRSLFDIVKEDDIISLKKELGNVPCFNIKNEKNMTLLHVALLYNAGRCTEYLIGRCVLFNEKDDYNNTPLQYARNYKHILMLTKKGAYL